MFNNRLVNELEHIYSTFVSENPIMSDCVPQLDICNSLTVQICFTQLIYSALLQLNICNSHSRNLLYTAHLFCFITYTSFCNSLTVEICFTQLIYSRYGGRGAREITLSAQAVSSVLVSQSVCHPPTSF